MPTDTNLDRAIYSMLAIQCPAMWLGFPIGTGHVYWVDGINGLDTNVGTRPNEAFQTIDHAMNQCMGGRNDYIIVLTSTSAVEPNWPIAIDVERVHLIGMSQDAYPYVRLESQDDTSTIQIGAVQHYEIAGFELGAGPPLPAACTNACIESIAGPATAGRGWIHHCSFGWLLGVLRAQDGIRIANTFDWCMSVVEHCLFNGVLAATYGITRDGIRIEGNSTRGIFRNNLFRNLDDGGVGIHCIQAGSDIGAILNNLFSGLPGIADGEAIWMELGVGNAMICGNRAGAHAAAPAFNPYRDSSIAGLGNVFNTWIDNQDSTPGAGTPTNVAPAA